jgi:cytochrome c-type biogenesis protein CcmH
VSSFLVAAALMALGASALVLIPLLRRGGTQGERATVSALVVVVALPLLAGWLYTRWSNWPWTATPAAPQAAAPEVIAMVEGLAARLASEGGSLEEWQMLGRSRVQLGQYDAAADAYRQAYRMSGGSDLPTLTSYAEALVLADPGALLADAGDLFERALAMSPKDQKALWYGGLAAFGREQYALARDRWQALIDHDPPPPEDVRRILADRVAVAASHLNAADASGGAAAAAPSAAADPSSAPVPADGAATANPSTADAGTPTAGDGAGRTIVVDVSVAAALSARVDPAASLFVLARTPAAAGPPLAVERRGAHELPLTVELSSEDAMMPGRTLSDAGEVEVVARVALGGGPTAQPGDLYGSAVVPAGGDAHVRIEIDRVQP